MLYCYLFFYLRFVPVLPSTRVSTVLSVSDLCAPPLEPLILQPTDKANLTEWFQSLWCTTFNSKETPRLTEKALHDDVGVCGDFIDAHVFIIMAETPEITPDQFDWYSYQGRAIGIQGDLNCGSICNGKILLGSYMKKPLWVDHSAVTVSTLPRSYSSCGHVFIAASLSSCTPQLFINPVLSDALLSLLSSKVFNLLTSTVSVIINGRESLFSPAQSFMVPCGKNILP